MQLCHNEAVHTSCLLLFSIKKNRDSKSKFTWLAPDDILSSFNIGSPSVILSELGLKLYPHVFFYSFGSFLVWNSMMKKMIVFTWSSSLFVSSYYPWNNSINIIDLFGPKSINQLLSQLLEYWWINLYLLACLELVNL